MRSLWTACFQNSLLAFMVLAATSAAAQPPKVVVISLDGAQPDRVEQYFQSGDLDPNVGLGRLRSHGVVADQNITVTPSVTAVAHTAIATGSTAGHNDITGNSIHPVAGSVGSSLSGFGAPVGGYTVSPLGPAAQSDLTAEPLWIRARAAGKSVVTATWPVGDGAEVRVGTTVVQTPTPNRTVDYTVPFGAFGGLGARGFALTAAGFSDAAPALVSQLVAAGHPSFSQVRVTTNPIETFFCAPTTASTCGTQSAVRTVRYDIKVAALDSTNDGIIGYDTLVFFEATAGVLPGPFNLPSTGPAYARAGGPSALFYLEGTGNKIGTAFFVSALSPNLSDVRFLRYGANFIPRNDPVLVSVDDINTHVGFWPPQADFRIPERIGDPFTGFPDIELETAYRDQVVSFVDYQTRIALRAIARNPDADLVMIYIEQPDGSGHQFTLTDPRQPTNPLDKTSIGTPDVPAGATGQDAAKIARYATLLRDAYRAANNAVERILQATGLDKHGEPLSNVIVVSDHGMAPFHTAVNLTNLLQSAGVSTTGLNIRTTGPAANIYVTLVGRESDANAAAPPTGNGAATSATFQARVSEIANALAGAVDPNPFYNPTNGPVFTDVFVRPDNCGHTGFCTNEIIGQDSGDILVLMREGYNFDGTQAVTRLGDTAPASTIYSVPNFYGAHGHNSELRSMSAIFYAAGPDIKKQLHLPLVHNIDVAPTVLQILGVQPNPNVDGEPIRKILVR